MNQVARQALEKLLRRAENASGKDANTRTISLRFSGKSFPAYFSVGTHADKDACHGDLQLAQREGAIAITWERQAGAQNQIERIHLCDRDVLARFLGTIPRWDAVAAAVQVLSVHFDQYPLLRGVIDVWRRGVNARGTGPTDVKDWLDAIAVVEHCRGSEAVDIPVRRLSANLTGDSKRIESLWPVIDALVQGDIAAPSLEAEEVFNEIGLVKFPPTLLVAGDLYVEVGSRKTQVRVEPPYLGFSPPAFSGFVVSASTPVLLTVENLTTFHEMALRQHESPQTLLLYTGGMPSPSWKRVYRLLLSVLPAGARVLHWGDIDAGGFRIADHLAACAEQSGRALALHAMSGEATSLTSLVARRKLLDAEVAQIERICKSRRWIEASEWVSRYRVAVEQESIQIAWP